MAFPESLWNILQKLSAYVSCDTWASIQGCYSNQSLNAPLSALLHSSSTALCTGRVSSSPAKWCWSKLLSWRWIKCKKSFTTKQTSSLLAGWTPWGWGWLLAEPRELSHNNFALNPLKLHYFSFNYYYCSWKQNQCQVDFIADSAIGSLIENMHALSFYWKFMSQQ